VLPVRRSLGEVALDQELSVLSQSLDDLEITRGEYLGRTR